MAVDLHTHTTASDGSFTPEELINKAVECGLWGVAITDHDTVGGLADAVKAAAALPVRVIPGIELSTDWSEEEIHVLGYFIDYNFPALLEVLVSLERERWQRGKRMLVKLRKIGIDVSWDRVVSFANGEIIGRPHVAQAMMAAGYVRDIREAFEKYLAKGRPGYISRVKLTPQRAVNLIKTAGGVPVLAHPGLLKNQGSLGEILTWGFKGIEAYYPQHSEEQVRLYLELAGRHDLVVTGGSDFHGTARGENFLGAATVKNQVVRDLLNFREGMNNGSC